MYPDDLILNTDLATLSDDNSATVSLTLPSSQYVGASSFWRVSQNIHMPGSGVLRAVIKSSKSNSYYPTPYLSIARSGWSQPFISAHVMVIRTDENTVMVELSVLNTYSSSVTGPSGAETFTVKVRSVEMPY